MPSLSTLPAFFLLLSLALIIMLPFLSLSLSPSLSLSLFLSLSLSQTHSLTHSPSPSISLSLSVSISLSLSGIYEVCACVSLYFPTSPPPLTSNLITPTDKNCGRGKEVKQAKGGGYKEMGGQGGLCPGQREKRLGTGSLL